MGKNIGIQGIEAPEISCTDKNCPFHGSIKIRGRIFKGEVVSDKTNKGIIIEFDRIYKIQKFERFAKKKTRLRAHNPSCINAKLGDVVIIGECRPISKTKSFVVIKNESVNK